MIPNECKLPDLSSLDGPLIKFLFPRLLGGETGISRKAALYRRNIIRLIDKGIFEYQQARQAIINDINEAKRPTKILIKHGRQIFFIGFVNHFESSINAIARVIKLIDRIKGEIESPNIPKTLRKLIESYSKEVPDLRNAIEHMDEIIQKDELQAGQLIMLGMSEDGECAVIAGYAVKFSDFASLIKHLHSIALHLLEIKVRT